MQRIAALVLFVVLVALPTAARPTPRAVGTLLLLGPGKGSTVETADVNFAWNPVAISDSYLLTIQNADGSKSVSVPYEGGDWWCDGGCTVGFIASDHDWIWKEGATYLWQVKAKDAEGAVIAKSRKWSFTIDILKKIVIHSPADGETVEASTYLGLWYFNVNFSTGTNAFVEFRIRLYDKNGAKVGDSTTSINCSSGCTLGPTLPATMASGETEKLFVKLTGKHPDVSGTMKSPKIAVKVHKP